LKRLQEGGAWLLAIWPLAIGKNAGELLYSQGGLFSSLPPLLIDLSILVLIKIS
jgi:hypothetical protein